MALPLELKGQVVEPVAGRMAGWVSARIVERGMWVVEHMGLGAEEGGVQQAGCLSERHLLVVQARLKRRSRYICGIRVRVEVTSLLGHANESLAC